MPSEKHTPGMTVGVRVLWKQLLANPSVTLTILVAVLMAVTFLAATPRLVQNVSDEALNAAITDPPVQQRNLVVTSTRRIGASVNTDPMRIVRKTGAGFAEQEFSPTIQSIIRDQTYIVDSPEFVVSKLTSEKIGPFPTFVRFRYQDRIDEHSSLVRGRMPGPNEPLPMLQGADCPEDLHGFASYLDDPGAYLAAVETYVEELESNEDDEIDCVLEEIPVFEVAMTTETLSVLDFGLDEMVLLTPDAGIGVPFASPQRETLFRQVPLDELDYNLILLVTGEIELTDRSLDYWYGDERLHRASITENADFRIISVVGLFDEVEYGPIIGSTRPVSWRYNWRHFIDPGMVEASSVTDLSADLQNLQVGFGPTFGRGNDFVVATRLPTLIDEYLHQREVTGALMSIALAGVFAIGAALILELAGLATLRQRMPIILIRNRGASRTQLTLARTYQALFVVGPAAAIGYLIAERMAPETEDLLSYRIAAAFAVAAIAVFVIATLPLIGRRLGALQRAGTEPGPPSRLRTVAEILVIVIALGATVLLRRRGQIDTRTELTFDPLLAATPALLGLAAGLVTLRIYPLLVGFASRLVSKGKGLVSFVGLRRILQQPAVARVPLLVVLMAVAVAVLSQMVRSSIEEGQQASAWQAVGADYSALSIGLGAALPRTLDLSDIDSVQTIAEAIRFPRARSDESQSRPFEYLAIDAVAYEQIVSGTIADPDIPEFMFVDRGEDSGTSQSPMPVVVSARGWPNGRIPIVGDVFTLDLDALKPVVVVEAVRERWPGVSNDLPFVISDIRPIDALSQPRLIGRTELYLAAPESAGWEIAESIDHQTNSVRFNSRYETLSDLSDPPLVKSVDVGLIATAALSITFAAIAAVSSLALSAAVRRRDLGYLRTMGLESNQATIITIIEQLPMLLVGVGIGAVLGAGMVIVLQPAITLDAFTGGLVPATIQYDWVTIAVSALVLVVILSIAIVIFVAISGRDDLGKLLKVGEE